MSRTAFRRTALLLNVIALAACSESTGPGNVPARITALPRALTGTEQLVIDANTTMGLSLLRTVNRVSPADSTVVLSPLSLSMALGMALNGAADTTYAEMQRTLGFPANATLTDVNTAYKEVLPLLRGLDSHITYTLANSVWLRTGFPVQQSFTDAVRTAFEAEVQTLDFSAPSALGTINGWVATKTNGRIPTILETIPSDAVAYLINAIYFKADWRAAFDKARTSAQSFEIGSGRTMTVQMMSTSKGTGRIGFSNDGTEIAELPYGGDAWVMTIVQPPTGKLDAFIDTISAPGWRTLTTQLTGLQTDIHVSMPRFTSTVQYALKDLLRTMGMRDAFSDTRANFTKLSTQPAYITDVRQRVFIKVDEVGTEAAAATSVGFGTVSLPVGISVRRPFLFAIRERLSGTVLFIGKVVRPSE